MYLSTYLFIYLFIYSFNVFIYLFIYLFIQCIYLVFIYLLMYLFSYLHNFACMDLWVLVPGFFRQRSKGGDVNSRVQAELLDVQQICGSSWAFAALLGDKTVVTWGDPLNGGDSSAVKERLQDVVELFA